jgi:hypothetical protein
MSNAASIRQPLDDEDVVGEILCRLPPQPSSIIRASLAVKLWRNHAVTSAFRRRLRAHHRHAPVLGVYEKHARTLRFIPAFDAPDRIPAERFSLKVCADHSYKVDNWAVLGCRHGRVLIVNRTRRELLVFDPISGDCREVAFPADFVNKPYTTNGAVVCEDEGIGDSTKFRVVLVGVWGKGRDGDLSARVYCSETSVWGDLVSAPEHPKPCRVGRLPCTLAGNGLYWWLTEPHGCILHFDLGSQQLAVIIRPPVADINIGCSRIIRAEDGGIGLAVLSYPTFRMYDRKVSSHGSSTWVMRKVVEMDKILGYPASMEMEVGQMYITGYTEEAGAIVVCVHYGRKEDYLYVVQLDSMRYKEIGADFLENAYYPYANFYTGGKCIPVLHYYYKMNGLNPFVLTYGS